jgi:aminoglycoside phosphotransferase (APT) family kinase protein
MPAAEVSVSEDLVRRLLQEQHPDLSALPLRFVDEGWDNVTYRLGEELAVRLPRRHAAVPLLAQERRWLPEVSRRLEVAVPIELRVGRPSVHYPWIWSIVRWIPGRSADLDPLSDDQAGLLAKQLRLLHRPAPDEAPTNPLRGEALRTRDAFARDRISALAGSSADERAWLLETWSDGVAAVEATGRVWIHGDLHPRNVVVVGGEITGIIDWGDLTSGDPATDVVAAWTLLDSPDARAVFLEEYGADGSTQRRARAWAVFFGAAMRSSGEARHERIGQRILERLFAGQGGDA